MHENVADLGPVSTGGFLIGTVAVTVYSYFWQ
jgi:hypothetical protein